MAPHNEPKQYTISTTNFGFAYECIFNDTSKFKQSAQAICWSGDDGNAHVRESTTPSEPGAARLTFGRRNKRTVNK